MTSAEPAAGRGSKPYFPTDADAGIPLQQWESLASGYAAVWAAENTREALFDAMRRRETYATTGPRMSVRFFGGWDFAADDLDRPNYAHYAYQHGVPMGAHLPPKTNQRAHLPPNTSDAPRFLITAMKDPDGANLDRIQVIKGWVDVAGNKAEKVYNVAASDGRKIRRNKVKAVGNTVDIENATWRNSIGDDSLAVVWQDPDFNPQQRAFYYVRVLEIPTPRWTTVDAQVFGDALPEAAPAFGQERAYTSPIWYTPTP